MPLPPPLPTSLSASLSVRLTRPNHRNDGSWRRPRGHARPPPECLRITLQSSALTLAPLASAYFTAEGGICFSVWSSRESSWGSMAGSGFARRVPGGPKAINQWQRRERTGYQSRGEWAGPWALGLGAG